MTALRYGPALLALVLLSACAPTPETPDVTGNQARETQARPELTLNLPRSRQRECDCPDDDGRDTRFFERGLTALATGQVVEATEYFQRHQRLEESAVAQWEAEVAIAWVGMLPESPFFDREAVAEAVGSLSAARPGGGDHLPHPAAVLMLDALASFTTLHRHLEDLEQVNATLEDDLEKREEAIKRLRELTLGQTGGARP